MLTDIKTRPSKAFSAQLKSFLAR